METANAIVVGDVVSGLEPNELVEVRRLVPFGPRTLLVGVTLQSRREMRRPLTDDELRRLTKIRSESHSFDGDPQAFLLGAEAERIRIAHQFDPLFAVNSSVVDILPHQVEAVYRYLLPLPRIRFLLADDTGAGKTIMTGLLVKELLFRGVINKVLIITPGGLTGQWRDEMVDKFGLHFRLVNRASYEAEPGQFSRQGDGLFVTSIDFISRNEQCLSAAKETQWDMIVVDEAHKLSAYEYGTKIERSVRYEAVEALASRTDHLLFLTATPHRGRKDTFRRFLMLLDDDLFQKDEHVTERIHEAVAAYTTSEESFEGEASISKARNRFFLRRLKEEMVDWNCNPLFKPRHTKTVGYELTPKELDLYNAVTKYVRSQRKEAKAKRNRNVELTLMVMQRRLASSIYAITRTLTNRVSALDGVLQTLRDSSRTAAEKRRLLRGSDSEVPADIGEYEELDETQRDAVDSRIFRQVLTDNPEEVEREREEVSALLQMAEDLRQHNEAKFAELLTVLDTSGVIRDEKEKLVIFTEHKDTLDNLAQRLTNKGYPVATIHGGMDVEARTQAQRDFRVRAKIMVATDAAGEGINLQFCRYLINWDVPWNPNRLEQRMGRIHRYGQADEVYVFNLVAINTREGAVLQTVLHKMDVMRDQMGTDRVYDVIDELLEDVPLVRLMEQSIDSADNREAVQEAERRTSGLDSKAGALVALQKKQSLASRLDLRAAKELRDLSDERRLQPLFVQRFFTAAYLAAGGSINEDKHYPVFHTGRVPSALLDVARQIRLPVADKYDNPFVFDKSLVSVASRVAVPEYTKLLGPGHPLFDALIEWAIRRAREAFARGAVLIDPNIVQPQRLWLVRSVVDDGRHEQKVRKAHEQLNVIIADSLGLRSTSPAHLLTCTTPGGNVKQTILSAASPQTILSASHPAARQTGLSASPSFKPYDPEGETHRTHRRLPHWFQEGSTYFVTFRLADSLPQDKLKQWQEQRAIWLGYHPGPWSDEEWDEYDERFGRKLEEWLDAGYGACELARAEVRQIVESCLAHFDGQRYDLGDYVIMPNHAHLLIRPHQGFEFSAIMKGIKGVSARECNKLLQRQGTFWMDESFDHIVRSAGQLARFQRYIAENPDRAGIKQGAFGLSARQTIVSAPEPAAGRSTPPSQTGWSASPTQTGLSGPDAQTGLSGPDAQTGLSGPDAQTGLSASRYTAEDIQAWAWEHVTEQQVRKVTDHRQAECDPRRRYLNTTFTDLILDLQTKLNELHQQQLLGEDDEEERQKLEQRLQQLKERKVTRMAELDLMLRLTANLPEIVTSAVVLPAPVAVMEAEMAEPTKGVAMQRDDQVERIAMEVAMRYERGRGWTPHDVSKDGEHYDVRSESPIGDKRYIEVKGRAQSGVVVITGPELDKLRQLADRAFLYVVTFCKGDKPRLRIIQDPIAKLNPEMLYRQVQFLVQEADWKAEGQEVEAQP